MSQLQRPGGSPMARLLCGLALWVSAAGASANPLAEVQTFFREKIEVIQTAALAGQWETYVTGYAWHVPWAYGHDERSRLNETTWGGGFGRWVEDARGDRNAVYLLALSDSHRDLQFIGGYLWQRYWNWAPKLDAGLGYSAFFFARKDVADYLPVPALLPCFSLRCGAVEVLGLYVPQVGKSVKGDVFFVFMRIGR